MSTRPSIRKSSNSVPRWVIWLGIGIVAIAALFVSFHLTGLMPMGHGM